MGAIVRVGEQSRLAEARRAEERLEELRLKISREMHDLIAYSMSQTALRAQRAAADASYPEAARQEFAALETTAADALHELRTNRKPSFFRSFPMRADRGVRAGTSLTSCHSLRIGRKST